MCSNMRSAPRGGRANRDGEAWERSDLGGAIRGSGGRQRVEHVTESGGSRVTWQFGEMGQARQRIML